MTSRPLPVFGKVVSRNVNDDSFLIELDRSSEKAPVITLRAVKAQGSFMGDVGGDTVKPRFVPDRPKGIIKDGKEIIVSVYLPNIDQRVFAVVVDSGSGLTLIKWSFESWFNTTQTIIDERIKRETRERLERELASANALLDAIDDAIFGGQDVVPQVTASASDSDTVFTTDPDHQSQTLGDIAAAQGTPFKAPRKGKANGAPVQDARPAVQA